MMKVLSLFDGISCGMVALEKAGISVKEYYASEIDEHAEAVSKHNYPNIIRLGDVNGYLDWNIDNVDFLIAGFPCQDLSIAKANRKGLNGKRSGLFWRLVDCIEKYKPKYILIENNNSMPKEAKETISEILGFEPIMINSEMVSAQLRKRLHWIGKRNENGTYSKVEILQPADKGILLQSVLESGTVDRKKSLCLTRRYAGFNGSQSYLCRRYFGKSFGQAVFEGNIDEIKSKWEQNPYFESDDKNIRQMTPLECERLQTLPEGYTKYGLYGEKCCEARMAHGMK
jgi:DNA (cytosine-5)-methyltransferase 3A